MILHTTLRQQWQKVNQILESQQTLHILSSRASYGASIVRILDKIDRAITAVHCMKNIKWYMLDVILSGVTGKYAARVPVPSPCLKMALMLFALSSRVGSEYSEEFEVGVGVHQGSVLSPLLFIIVLEALSRDFRVGVPWELFFADDLVIIATSLEECVERVKAWKEGLESKGLHVNMTKTKFMASGIGLDILQDSGKFPCAVCRTGVGRSSIRCSKCNLWVHYKKCSGLKTLSEDLSYECPRCRGVPGVRPVDGRPFKEVEVGDCVLEAVDRFCYLGDMLSAGGGCMAAATARCRCAWGKFRKNLPLLTSKPVPFDLRGRLFSSNVRSSMLHGTETWPMTSAALHRLCRNDRAMICWICGVKPSDDPSMDELHAKLGICDLAILVRERRLRWFGHVMRSNGEINRVRSRPVPERKGPGRPKKTWEECVKQDLKVCGLSEAGTQDRLSWRSSVKNSRQKPTPSNGSLPQSMAAPPARRVLGMRTRSFNKTGFDWLIDWSWDGCMRQILDF